jgi:prevent-host-death family protein
MAFAPYGRTVRGGITPAAALVMCGNAGKDAARRGAAGAGCHERERPASPGPLVGLAPAPRPAHMTHVVTKGPPMKEMQFREAKARLSAVVDAAEQGEPSLITRHGKPAAVVIGFEEWRRLSEVPSFARLLMACPIEEGDLPERDQTPMRDPGF